MNRSMIVTLAAAGTLSIAGLIAFCSRLPTGVSAAMTDADTFEVLSIDPERLSADEATTVPTAFHDHRVLGRTTVADPAVRRRLAAALRGGVPWELLPEVPRCFSPRLGLRLTHSGQTVDLLVCFACNQGYAYRDGDMIGAWVTDRSPKPAFDALLTAAGVPLATDDD